MAQVKIPVLVYFPTLESLMLEQKPLLICGSTLILWQHINDAGESCKGFFHTITL